MLKRLVKEDINLLINFYHQINDFNEHKIRLLYDKLDENRILCANIENEEITSLLITNIIKNDYYIEEILFLKLNVEEIKSLISFTILELRKDGYCLNVYYENFPYSELMHNIMTENGFKNHSLNLIYDYHNEKAELIKPYIAINDKSQDVVDYIYKNYLEEIKSRDAYLGETSLIPNHNIIKLDNTNVAVIRNKDNKKVMGTVVFGIVSDSLYLSSLYADDEETLKDLIVLVKNLTRKRIEIHCYPMKEKIISVLEKAGFIKYQSDYKLKLV